MNSRFSAIVSPLAAAFSASCCVLPMAPLAMGFTGLGPFVFLMRYRTITLAVSILMLAGAFYVVYRPQAAADCARGVCTPRSLHRQRVLVWLSAGLMVAFVAVVELLPFSMNVGE